LRRLSEVLYILDRLAEVLRHLEVRRAPLNKRSFVGRFHVAIPNVVLPLLIVQENDIVARGSLEPSTTLHVHENFVFLSKSLSLDLHSLRVLSMSQDGVVGINIGDCDEVLLLLLASAIAERLSLEPEAMKIIKLLPNNLRILVERASSEVESDVIDIAELHLKIPQLTLGREIQRRHIVELRVWSSKNKTIEFPYEISYVKSFGFGYLKLRYLGGEVDVRTISLSLADTVLPRLIPTNAVEEMSDNVMRALRILNITARLLSRH